MKSKKIILNFVDKIKLNFKRQKLKRKIAKQNLRIETAKKIKFKEKNLLYILECSTQK